MAETLATPAQSISPRRMLIPLALAQFICSFAGSNMNVAISSISKDLGTTVHGVQTAITLFLLFMAALMIPGSKLTDIWGRKRCFIAGLSVYGIGAVIAALAPGLGVLIVGYSAFEGVGSALLIPPVYILTTLLFDDTKSRARAFGLISGMGGIGAAAGPLIGGLITTTISWRVSFLLQAAVVGAIILLSRRIVDPLPPDPHAALRHPRRRPVGGGHGLSGLRHPAGRQEPRAPDRVPGGGGCRVALVLPAHPRPRDAPARSRCCRPGCSTTAPRTWGWSRRTCSGSCSWAISFVVSVFLQTVRGFSAIETGLVFTAATVGILLSSMTQERLAKRFAQKTLILAGFIVTLVGIGLLLGLVHVSSNVLVFLPGLFFIGLGIGTMLTPSVNIVQSAFPEEKQGEISGLSRSISNLGSSLGTAIAGTILVSDLAQGNRSYAFAMIALAVVGIIGLGATLFLHLKPAAQ